MEVLLHQIDAFADAPFSGNPAAVMPLPSWLPDALLQHLAEENNLAETAFYTPELPAEGGPAPGVMPAVHRHSAGRRSPHTRAAGGAARGYPRATHDCSRRYPACHARVD
ncbi:PhzF family phenazine biosynthesis protein, partial [Nocardia cyriacigeorgica]|uniref:PhzF family phenazine biosynthesis protein n=1 Tax=Nocardia cyriacigeorgica TaxID=135487 RepID=UPI0024562BDB